VQRVTKEAKECQVSMVFMWWWMVQRRSGGSFGVREMTSARHYNARGSSVKVGTNSSV
jgi:hypothetical protein